MAITQQAPDLGSDGLKRDVGLLGLMWASEGSAVLHLAWQNQMSRPARPTYATTTVPPGYPDCSYIIIN